MQLKQESLTRETKQSLTVDVGDDVEIRSRTTDTTE